LVETTRLPGAVRVAGRLLIGQSIVFVAAMVLAVRELGQVPTVPVDDFDAADFDRLRVVMTSVVRDRVVFFVLLTVGLAVVGTLLLRRPGIGPWLALFGINVLLVAAWADTLMSALVRSSDSEVDGLIHLASLPPVPATSA